MWNEQGSGLARLCKVAEGKLTFVDAEIEYANRHDPGEVSKEERQTMAAASACSQLTQIAEEHIPKTAETDHDERWRSIKIQTVHYDEYAKLLDRYGPGTAFEDGPEAAGLMKIQSVCLLEDQTLSDWSKQYMGKASVMPNEVKTAIKHLSMFGVGSLDLLMQRALSLRH